MVSGTMGKIPDQNGAGAKGARGPAPRGQSWPRPALPPEPPAERILLVEDEPFDARAIARVIALDARRYHVSHAATCADARVLLGLEAFSLVLLDQSLPDGPGLELLEGLSEEGGRLAVPVVLVTSDGDEALAAEALRRGVSDYLIKDMDLAYLARVPGAIRRAIDRRKEEEARERALKTVLLALTPAQAARLQEEIAALAPLLRHVRAPAPTPRDPFA